MRDEGIGDLAGGDFYRRFTFIAASDANHLHHAKSRFFDEIIWRFDNRNNPYLFRDMVMKLVEAPVLEYKKFTAA